VAPGWKQFEQASADGLKGAGYNVAEQVRVTWEGAKDNVYAVLDAIGVKDKNIVLLEAKDGLASKLSDAQKAVFREALKSGNIRLLDERAARTLGLAVGRSLAVQGSLYASVNAASLGSRALGQFGRIAMRGAATLEGINWVGIVIDILSMCGSSPASPSCQAK
jgi:hypothetical protein